MVYEYQRLGGLCCHREDEGSKFLQTARHHILKTAILTFNAVRTSNLIFHKVNRNYGKVKAFPLLNFNITP
jgi:hypothetical protein